MKEFGWKATDTFKAPFHFWYTLDHFDVRSMCNISNYFYNLRDLRWEQDNQERCRICEEQIEFQKTQRKTQ